jgi:putative peptidoglycan lipid II flippase
MAAGTVVSRLSGFVRLALLAAALGNGLHADVFNIANTIPNMLYILLAGGVFNAVLVPQLVRAMKHDPDGGDGYTNRIITLAGVFLAGVTAVLVVLAPWLMRLFLTGCYFTPALAAQRDSAIDLARYCLPQVFFYGMFVLVGQVLNARGRFGPMMWAPIANNVISVAVLGAYLGVFGYAHDAAGAYSPHQELLLGVGSTLGIVAQFAILLPYMRAAGFTFRPRFDFRGYGLGHTLRLGLWTVLFVVVNQIAYTVVVRLASSGTAQAACGGGSAHGTGYTIYDQTFLLVMVPHSVATVSLATAVLPQLSAMAAGEDLAGVSRTLAGTLRTALVVIIPFALLLPVVALDLSHVLWGRGAAGTTYPLYAPSLSLFAIVLVFFTTHYLMLRGFYAFERTRTVFWVQCAVAATNVALAVAFTRLTSPVNTAPALVLAYAAAYLVGAACSYSLLRRLLGGLETGPLARFLARLVPAAGLAALAAWAVRTAVDAVWPADQGWVQALVPLTAAALGDLVVFLALARALRLTEVTEMVGLVTSRLRR